MKNSKQQQPVSKKPNQKRQLNKYARYSGVAFQMIAIIVIGSFIGIKLDNAYPNKYELYTIICTLIAVTISMVYVIKQVNNSGKNNTGNDQI